MGIVDAGVSTRHSLAEVQALLPAALRANTPGGRVPHVVVILPSYDVTASVLEHYGPRIPALEHRFLSSMLMLPRFPGAEILYVCGVPPEHCVLDYYLSLVPAEQRDDVAARFHVLALDDRSYRPVAAKLVERPDLLSWVRALIGDRPALIEPWNVAALEERLAIMLGIPVNGTPEALWPLGFKSSGRRLLARAGVPVPRGREDVHDPEDAQDLLEELACTSSAPAGVVIKLDNSVAGDGVVMLRPRAGALPLRDLPDWFVGELRRDGGVVEELVAGDGFASPSVQLELSPTGAVTVLSTHEQLLGGPDAQVYEGCTFPADARYAPRLGAYGRAIGGELALHGVVGRVSVDFVAVRGGAGEWDLRGLEINLRKGGTSHTFSVLRQLVPGRYDLERGSWLCPDGSTRHYRATDNLVDGAWLGIPARDVIAESARRGLTLDPAARAGVVLHMFEALALDGRVGVTAVGRTPSEAQDFYDATRAMLDDLAVGRGPE